MTYDLAEHPLLDSVARELSVKKEESFKAQVALAAELLGISALTFTGDTLAKIKRYLALQVNYQLQLPPEVFIKKQASSQASKQNATYRDGIALVNPLIAQAVAVLIETETGDDAWENIRSVRRQFL